MIDTATNMVVATDPGGGSPVGVAVTPDGKHAYVTNGNAVSHSTVSVIDTATNMVVAATRPGGDWPPVGSPSPRMGNTSMSRIYVTVLVRRRLGDRHGHQHGGGGHGRGGWLVPYWGRRHPGRETRLCRD